MWSWVCSAIDDKSDDVLWISSQEVGPAFGYDGATSLKSELASRLPRINDAPTFAEARRLLTQLGGSAALQSELAFAGVVDPVTDELTVDKIPFNVFAQFASGKMKQPSLAAAQEALGEYKDKFLICANLPENDLHWDSDDPKWISKASMAMRHRFLTTKNLHWQWFNMLTVGLLPAAEGGVALAEAIKEIEAMKAAALRFAKHVGGWSDQVGLYVNVFGHNNVNSLFVHILDMSEVGPGFAFQAYKNCPLDDVLKVLHAELAAGGPPWPLLTRALHSTALQCSGKKRPTAGVAFTGGATSVKEEIMGRLPQLKDAAAYREARRMLTEELGGVASIKNELERAQFVYEESNMLTVGTNPVNIFAQIASDSIKQPGMDIEQMHLGPEYRCKFKICCNRPENDAYWDSDEPAWVGKASMSRRHKFLTTKKLHFQWFNALVFGLVDESLGGASKQEAFEEVTSMKAAALEYTKNAVEWSDDVGLFFHVFGHNNVNSLHMHILDMNALGPSYYKHEYRNCPVDAVIKVLREEMEVELVASLLSPDAQISSLASEGIARLASAGAGKRRPWVRGTDADTVLLDVGGERLSVARDALLMAPERSLLRRVAAPRPEDGGFSVDGDGRVFLNFPPRAFKHITDHLVLLQMAPSDVAVKPPSLPGAVREEVEHLAWLLGVWDLVVAGAQWGRGAPLETSARPRPPSLGWSLCGPRRRPPPPPPPPRPGQG
mmetsp:Transcript_110424/g.352050  ORF Transcript_110424/g.352050 Transcript_110424/m.352050 type:complete len:721 (-) Transcript_110424:20-2182(-)